MESTQVESAESAVKCEQLPALLRVESLEGELWPEKLSQIAGIGYSGVIVALEDFRVRLRDQPERLAALTESNLTIAIEVTTRSTPLQDRDGTAGAAGSDAVTDHVSSFRTQIVEALALGPQAVYVRGGCDYWDVDDKVRFYGHLCEEISKHQRGAEVVLCHKTAAGTALSHPADVRAVLEAVPALSIGLELGQLCAAVEGSAAELTTCQHWCGLLAAMEHRVSSISASVGSAHSRHIPYPAEDLFSAELRAHEHWWSAILSRNAKSKAPVYIDVGTWRDCQLAMPFTRVPITLVGDSSRFLVKRIRAIALKEMQSQAELDAAEPAAAEMAGGAVAVDDKSSTKKAEKTIQATPDRCPEILSFVDGLLTQAQKLATEAVSFIDLKRRSDWLENGIDASLQDEIYTKVECIPPKPGRIKRCMILKDKKMVEWLVYSSRDDDTLEAIAREKGIRFTDLTKLNQDRLPNLRARAKLYEGTLVLLPQASSSSAGSSNKKRRIKEPRFTPFASATNRLVQLPLSGQSNILGKKSDGAEAGATQASSEMEENVPSDDDGQLYAMAKTKENDTPNLLAKLYKCSAKDIVDLNKSRFPGLQRSSKFRADTDVLLPTDATLEEDPVKEEISADAAVVV